MSKNNNHDLVQNMFHEEFGPRDSFVFQDLYMPQKSNFDGMQKINNLIEKSDPDEYYVKTNSFGYRSEEFTSYHQNKVHVLFNGCSETFGEGGPIEDTWAYMLHKKINLNIDTSGFFSLGTCGAGYEDIISKTIDYINSFEKPDYIFILFPNLVRKISWVSKDYNDVPLSGFYLLAEEKENQLIINGKQGKIVKEISFYDRLELFVSFLLAIKILEDYCNKLNIKLFWSTWNQELHSQLLKYQKMLNNFCALRYSSEMVYDLIEKENLKLKKEDGHHGSVFHRIWSDIFYDQMQSL